MVQYKLRGEAMAIVLSVAGTLLLLNGIYLCVFSNMDLGVVLTVLLGLVFLAWGIFYKKIAYVTRKGFWRVFKIVVLSLLSLELVFAGVIAIYGQSDNANYVEDAVIVLGAGIHGEEVSMPLKLRLDKAIEYNQRNPEALVVVTGGKGPQETITEAEAMERYLVEHGVSKNIIVKEENATSTNENMRFSKEILDSHFGREYDVAVITNGFHIFRGVSIAEREGLGYVTHLHAGLQWYNWISCYLRESLAILKMWTIG